MTENNSKHAGRKIAVGSLIAGGIGYLAGILSAPKSGNDTRKAITDKADDIKVSTEDQLHELNDELKGLINTAKSKTLNLNSTARSEFNEAVIKAKDTQNKTAQVIKAVKSGEAADPDLNRAIKQAKQSIKNLGKFFQTK